MDKRLLFGLMLLGLMTIANAQLSNISSVIDSMCLSARTILGVAMMLMIILAAVIYAIGQVMGAETRARATVWATAMLTGAIVAAVILMLAPWIASTLIAGTAGGTSVTISC